jgi:hypothetical protein
MVGVCEEWERRRRRRRRRRRIEQFLSSSICTHLDFRFRCCCVLPLLVTTILQAQVSNAFTSTFGISALTYR